MTRLLFAAARGARIGYETVQGWRNEDSIDAVVRNPSHFCIHPDDEHLQYGPISTALRKCAETGGVVTEGDWGLTAMHLLKQANEGPSFVPMKEDVFINLALILAEYVADEGL